MKSDVATQRPPRRTGRTAINAGGFDGVEKHPVGTGILGENGLPACVVIGKAPVRGGAGKRERCHERIGM